MKNKEFKIRASATNQIMTNARSKAEILGLTAKTYCENWLKEQLYGRKIEFVSKYTQKGIENEQESIMMLNKGYEKNIIFFEDDYFTGTPDIITVDSVADIKNSFDISTFPLFDTEVNKSYWMQLQIYMHLTGRKKAELVYTLTDMPEHMIESEAWRYARIKGIDFTPELYDEFVEKFTYMDVSDSLKIKTFAFDYDENFIESVKVRVKECRNYINSINTF